MKGGVWALAAVPLATAVLAASASGSAPADSSATDKDCGDFPNQQSAQDYFISRGGPRSDPDRLDGDGDGIACESLPCPCASGGGAGAADEYSEALPEAGPRRIKATILSVVDGDTIKVRTAGGRRLKVRLIGIDAPELRPLECGARWAARNLRRLSLRGSRRVTLTRDLRQRRRDRYGRLLAYARTAAGRELGEEQVRAGWAMVHLFDGRFARAGIYQSREAGARKRHRGLWRKCGGDPHRLASA